MSQPNELVAQVYVEQVKHGYSYNGYIKFGDRCKLDYELSFPCELQTFDKQAEVDPEAAEKRICLTVKNQGRDITPRLGQGRRLMFHLLLPVTWTFYKSPETRNANQGKLRQRMHDLEVKSYGTKFSIGITRSITLAYPRFEDFLRSVA